MSIIFQSSPLVVEINSNPYQGLKHALAHTYASLHLLKSTLIPIRD